MHTTTLDQHERIALYKCKSMDELRIIQPRWAFAQTKDKILDQALRPPQTDYYMLMVETVALVKKSLFYEVDMTNLFTGEAKNDWRIATILHRWENGLYVDPPSVGIGERDTSKISFSDGRHRTKLAHFLRLEQIPVAILNVDVKAVQRILGSG